MNHQAYYTIGELVRFSGLTRRKILKFLGEMQIQPDKLSARLHVVYHKHLQSQAPDFLESMHQVAASNLATQQETAAIKRAEQLEQERLAYIMDDDIS